MLDGFAGGNQGPVDHALLLELHVPWDGFLDDAVDGRAIDYLRFGILHVEHLLDPPHVIFRFGQMMLKRRPKPRICTFFDHRRQRLQNLLLGVINVPEGLDKQLVHSLDILGKETHGFNLADWLLGLEARARRLERIKPLTARGASYVLLTSSLSS